MNGAALSGMSARVLRDVVLAVRGRPFRVALLLSLIVHLALLGFVGRGSLGGRDPRIPLMHVRLLPPEPAPIAVAELSAIKPEAQPRRRDQPGQPVAVVSPPAPASAAPDFESTQPAAEAIVPSAAHQPAPAETAVATESETSQGRQTNEAAGTAPAAAAPALSRMAESAAPSISSGAEQVSLAPAPVGGGSGGPTAAGRERDGREGGGVVSPEAGSAPDPGAVGAAGGAATAARPGPGSRDVAAVRRRIDAHKVYPPIAVRNGWEGRVLVEMRLEGDGRLTAVRLLEGSGYAVLDDATISAVRRASPFPPVARVLTVPVEYRLVP